MSPKSIKKLADKKYRTETGLFIVEGEKNIRELFTSDFVITEILGTSYFIDTLGSLIREYEERTKHHNVTLSKVREDELERIGTLVTNTAGIAVVKQKQAPAVETILAQAGNNIVLVLDDIRDPGNLGTIIRIADWYGVRHIVASPTTTDLYNPKTISASMGSFTRVSVSYLDLESILSNAHELDIPIIVADMSGTNVHKGVLPQSGFLVMGSESHGVREAHRAHASLTVAIPQFGGGVESLNVSIATGILLDTWRRQTTTLKTDR